MRSERTAGRLLLLAGLTLVPLITACGDEDGGARVEICDNGLDDDGDGLTDCEDPEDCATAPTCAAPTCGDGVCDEATETAESCLEDCHCGNGACDDAAPYAETEASCPEDCAPPACTSEDFPPAQPNELPGRWIGEMTVNETPCPEAGGAWTTRKLFEGAGGTMSRWCVYEWNGGGEPDLCQLPYDDGRAPWLWLDRDAF